ncbi:hypothetical protein D3C87_1632890 [compost metagenome]
MFVEAAVGETSGRHQFGHTHAVVAVLSEEGRCGLDDMRPVGLRLRLGDSHLLSLISWPSSRAAS